MKKILIGLMLAVLAVTPGMAMEVSEKDFEVKTTQDLVDLCTASPSDPYFPHAVNFCHGYLVGAYHFYEAAVKGEHTARFVCPPDSPPSRNEIIDMFIKWAKGHPQYLNELPVETEFRF